MKEINQLNLLDELYYTKEHEWAKVEGDYVLIGIDDYAQDQLGDIVFVEVPEVGAFFNAEEVFGSVESVKAVSDIYMPVSGEVIEVNEALEDNPELVNSSPYNEGWMIKVKPKDLSQLKKLMQKKEYIAMLENITD